MITVGVHAAGAQPTLGQDDGSPDGKDGADVLGTGTTAAKLMLTIDLDDSGTVSDRHKTFAAAGLGEARRDLVTFYLPPGAAYSVTEDSAGDGTNTAKAWERIL